MPAKLRHKLSGKTNFKLISLRLLISCRAATITCDFAGHIAHKTVLENRPRDVNWRSGRPNAFKEILIDIWVTTGLT